MVVRARRGRVQWLRRVLGGQLLVLRNSSQYVGNSRFIAVLKVPTLYRVEFTVEDSLDHHGDAMGPGDV